MVNYEITGIEYIPFGQHIDPDTGDIIHRILPMITIEVDRGDHKQSWTQNVRELSFYGEIPDKKELDERVRAEIRRIFGERYN